MSSRKAKAFTSQAPAPDSSAHALAELASQRVRVLYLHRQALEGAVDDQVAVIPVVTGALTMMGLADPIYAAAGLPASALPDSKLRCLGGPWLVAGLARFCLIPRTERESVLLRVQWPMVFLGSDAEARRRPFLDGLAAVSHALRHLVVQGDLKPANLLVEPVIRMAAHIGPG